MKKILLSFLALVIAAFSFSPLRANEVTIPKEGTSLASTTYLPIAINTNSSAQSAGCYSVSQQLYYASELKENSVTPSSTTIQAITFYYTAGTKMTRKLRVWMTNSSLANLPADSNEPNFVDPGTKVFSGDVELDESKGKYTIVFDTPFEWNGTDSKNIIITVFDSTGLFNTYTDQGKTVYTPSTSYFTDEGKVRFLHKISRDKDFANSGWTMDNLIEATAYSLASTSRKYVNKITFTFAAAEVLPATPDDLAVSSVTANSATLVWSAVEGANSYDLQQSANGSDWSSLATGETGTSYTWTGLSPESTQYVRIRAVNANGESDWSDAITVTTDATHEHNGITFSKWNSTTAMPTSGNYYLANDVEISGSSNVTLSGNLDLCLNGHNILTSSNGIIIPDEVTFAIYDNEGSGVIRGAYPGDYAHSGLISIENGGTLSIGEGGIVNLANDENDYNLAIDNKGTLYLSGAPTISGVNADIYLGTSKVISISGALTNSTPYTVNAVGQTITSGWSTNMSGEKPSDYFASVKSNYAGVCLSDGEAKLVKAFVWDNDDNGDAAGNFNTQANVILSNRTFTSAQYNTFCLPFALDDDQLQEFFGSGYDLQELTGSSLDGETLNLEFTKCTDLEAGKPYLLQPSVNVTNPVFEGVTITATSPGTSTTTYVDYKAVYSSTSLEGGNRNLLFLGAGNELFWPESTGNLNGFRAYFEIKDASAQAAKRARISMGGKIATGNLSPALPQGEGVKILRDGKLYLMYKGQMYDVQGKRM